MAREPQPQAVQWGPCAEKDPSEGTVLAGAQYGGFSVPLDHSRPDGERITIEVARLRATGDKIGSLVLNPGGPGVSGVEFLVNWADYIPQKLREHFNLVSFDPRGVGHSRPVVECNSDAEDDEERADPDVDYSPAGVAEIEKESRDYVQRCVAKTGKEFLTNVGTAVPPTR